MTGRRPGPALRTRIVPQPSLTPEQRRRMLALMHLCYEGVVPERFAADLADKQQVILLEVPGPQPELVGFSTLRVTEESLAGRPAEVVFTGDTVIHPQHWGSRALTGAFTRFLLSRKLRRPSRPVLWLLLSAGYRTYLLMIHNLPRAFPRRDRPLPAVWANFLPGLCRRWFGDQYDPDRGVVRFSDAHYHVRAGIAPINRQTARLPDIAFFQHHNPGHSAGDELVCLAEFRLRDLPRIAGRVLTARIRRAWRRSWEALGAWRGA